MKKTHIFLFLTAALAGLAFTRMSPAHRISSYKQAIQVRDSICDTVSFNAQIAPVFFKSCVGCHEGISDYKSVSEYSDHILKALKGEGAPLMPKDADPLPESFIQQYTCWIEQGKHDN
ncbi:MAG: hypothetical protein ACO1O6_09680 [Bacteroidota bacterium]